MLKLVMSTSPGARVVCAREKNGAVRNNRPNNKILLQAGRDFIKLDLSWFDVMNNKGGKYIFRLDNILFKTNA